MEHLHQYSFAVNNSLLRLILQKNNISILHIDIFIYLERLEFINLSNNKLKIISKSLFRFNKHLCIIYLENNILLYFNLLLDNFPKLTDLKLQNNKLSALNSIHFGKYLNNNSNIYNTKDRYINISGNRFNCNKSMSWITKLRKIIYIQIGFNTIYCQKVVDNNNVTLGCFLGIEPSRYPVLKYINC